MIFRKFILVCFCLFINISQVSVTWAEPFIVLKFSNQNQFSEGDGENVFSIDPNHSENYLVQSGDSVSSILRKFYTGSGLDWRFVQLSIVIANPKAFAKNNPNFLFSDSKLFLPGKADIAKLLVGKKIRESDQTSNDDTRMQSIYFFGG